MAINRVDSGKFRTDFRDQSRKRCYKTFRTKKEAIAFEKDLHRKPTREEVASRLTKSGQSNLDETTIVRRIRNEWKR